MPAALAPQLRGSCLDLYRIDVSSRIWPFLIPAAFLVTVGAMGVCTAFVTHGPLAERSDVISLVGAACMLAGLLLAILVVRPILTHDEYVAALEAGVMWRVAGEEGFLAWPEIEEVRWEGERATLVVRPREGVGIEFTRPFGRATGDEVAARLNDLRRKASFQLL
jgi:hypothetical protein